MKKFIRKNLFGFILGMFVMGTTGVLAAYSYTANKISYIPNDTTWKKSNGEEITTVEEAINELYSKTNKTATKVATLTGQGSTYTMQNNGYIVGTVLPTYRKSFGALYLNGKDVVVNPWDSATEEYAWVYAVKGDVISTRSDYGVYNIIIYELN